MPGVHTFYDGSRVLEPFSEVLGVDVDKVNLVFCLALSIPLAAIYYTVLSPDKTSRAIRVNFPTAVGLFFCYFCYGAATKHILANVLINYLLLTYSPPKHVHRIVFLFSMGYLTFIHFYRWVILSTYSIDITGSMMIGVQKITTLAFSIHDGTQKKPEELNEIQKREAIKEVPPLADYMSYLFHFQSVLTGPLSFYTDYMKLISGDNLKPINGQYPTPWRAAFLKFAQSAIFVAMILRLSPIYYPEMLLEPKQLELPWWKFGVLWWLVMAMQRVPYYFAWILADAICNLSGFGFNGYDAEGNERWDLITSVHPIKVEMATSFRDTLDGWNCMTMQWLRRVAYDRAPKKFRTAATYLLSAWWHGLFIGYYMTFFTGAIVTLAGKSFRRSFRWRFQSSTSLKVLYALITFTGTKIALFYTTFPFVSMHFGPGWALYKHVFFFVHVFCVLTIFVFPRFFRSERKPETLADKEKHVEEKKVE